MGSYGLPILPRMRRRQPGAEGRTLEYDLPTLDDYLDEGSPAVPIGSRLPPAEDQESVGIPRLDVDFPREHVGAAIPGRRMTIEAEPEYQMRNRLRMPAPDLPGEFLRTSRMDPNLKQAAMIDQGVAPDQYEAVNAPVGGPPVVPTEQKMERGGFWGTLKHMGRGALQGLAIGNRAGGTGFLGGALAGAAGGAVSPQAVERVDLKYNRMPQYQEDIQNYNRNMTQREALAGRIAQRVGFDPISGRETPEAEGRRLGLEDRRLGLIDRERRIEREDQQDRNQVAATAVEKARLLNQPVPKAAVQGTPYEAFAGIKVPSKYTQLQVNEADGVLYGLTTENRLEPILTATGEPFQPQQKGSGLTQAQAIGFGLQQARMEAEERRWQVGRGAQDRKEREAEQRQARVIKDKFEHAKKLVDVAAREYGNMMTALGQERMKDPKATQVYYKGRWIGEAEIAQKQSEADALDAAYEGVKIDARNHPGIKFRDDNAIEIIEYPTGGGGGGGAPAGGGGAPGGSQGIVKPGQLERYMQKNGVSYEQAVRDFQAEGYTIPRAVQPLGPDIAGPLETGQTRMPRK